MIRCGHSGGYGIGAGHERLCNRHLGHPFDSDRPRGWGCGATWADDVDDSDVIGFGQRETPTVKRPPRRSTT